MSADLPVVWLAHDHAAPGAPIGVYATAAGAQDGIAEYIIEHCLTGDLPVPKMTFVDVSDEVDGIPYFHVFENGTWNGKIFAAWRVK